MYLIQASPYSKVYMRQYAQLVEDHPDFAKTPWDHPLAGQPVKGGKEGETYAKTPFSVLIPRTLGSITMTHNKPYHISKILPVNPNRKNDDNNPNELQNAVEWLAGSEDGRPSEETAIYGVVRLKVDLDVASAIIDISQMNDEKAMANYRDLQGQLVKQTKVAVEEAREIANERVLHQMRITHRNLMKSYEQLRSQGHGHYTPSMAEAVGAHILHAELSKSSEKRQQMLESLDKLMGKSSFIG